MTRAAVDSRAWGRRRTTPTPTARCRELWWAERRRRWARRGSPPSEVEAVFGSLRHVGLGRAPGAIFVTASLLLAAASLAAELGPIGDLDVFFAFLFAWLGLLILWALRLFLVLSALVAVGGNRGASRRSPWRAARSAALRWGATPLATALSYCGCSALPLERFGFELSQEALQRRADEALRHPERAWPHRIDSHDAGAEWIGVIPVRRVERLPWGVMLVRRRGTSARFKCRRPRAPSSSARAHR